MKICFCFSPATIFIGGLPKTVEDKKVLKFLKKHDIEISEIRKIEHKQ